MGLLQAGGSCARAQRERARVGRVGRPCKPACRSWRCQRLAMSAHLHGAAHGGHAALREGQGGWAVRVSLAPAWWRCLACWQAPQSLPTLSKRDVQRDTGLQLTVAPEAATPVRAATVCMMASVLGDPQSRERLGGCR